MLQRELMVVISVATAVFLLVAGAGWFAVRSLNTTSRQLVMDTMPGLVYAGRAEETMHAERRLMREMVSARTASERLELINSLQANSTDQDWKLYENSIFEPEDRQNFNAMMRSRSQYLLTFPKFFDLVKNGKINEADAYYEGEQSRLFAAYLAASHAIFEYNVRQGEKRGQIILNAIRFAPVVIGLLCVLIFMFGLALGLRTALGGAK